MKKIFMAAAAAVSAIAVALPSAAATSAVWTQAGAAVFYRGTLDGLTLSDDGEIALAKKSARVLETDEPYIWSIAVDTAGGVFAGSGNKAAVYKLDGKGGSKQIAMLSGLGVTSLAPGQHGEIYAGTFPNGAISEITAAGGDKKFADLSSQYVWAMKVDKSGNIIAAGGSPGGVFRISPKGEVSQLLRTNERHILCLETDAAGNIYAGSSPNGYVYKIDAASKKVTVLADLTEEEVYRIADAGGGKLIVAANRDQMPMAPQGDAGPGAPPGAPAGPVGMPSSFPVPYNTPPPQARALPSAIYSLTMSGETRKLYSLPDPFILSLFKLDDTHYIVGTGNHGNVYTLDISKLTSALTQLPVKQILDIRPVGEKKLVYATGNPGAAYTFTSEFNATGTFKSTVNDTFGLSMWGKLWAETTSPDGAGVEFKTRTGNTSDPEDGTWSDWSAVQGDPSSVMSPPGRYIQYMAQLKTSAPAATPSVREVNLAYVAANQQPQINDLTVSQQPARRQPPQQDPNSPPSLQQRGPRQLNGSAGMPGADPQQPENNYQVGTLTANGEIILKWNVVDPDGDNLRYTLLFRRISDVRWAVLNDEFYGTEYRWQTESLPDGKYEAKLIASDAPSNPSDWARTEVKISDPFIIDNSRPTVTATIETRGRAAIVKGSVSDQTSIISGIEYSVDDLKWNAAFPDDRVFDTKTETFTLELNSFEPGGHIIVIRARDFTGNISSFSSPFTVNAR